LEAVKKVKTGGLACMSDLLVACALKKEVHGLRRKVGNRCEWLVTGLGVDRTLNTLESKFEEGKPYCLIFTGMAGQLDPEIGLGEVILPEVWQLESGTRFSVDSTLANHLRSSGFRLRGKGLTVSAPVVSRRKRTSFYEQTGALICDMESAAAMMIAASYGIPCVAPKVVSDTADSGLMAFYRRFDQNLSLLADYLDGLIPEISDPF
jgi:nucleoside phosphorylase